MNHNYNISEKDKKILKEVLDAEYIVVIKGLKNRPNLIIKMKLNSLLKSIKHLAEVFDIELIDDKYL
jgi:hypothetical protein